MQIFKQRFAGQVLQAQDQLGDRMLEDGHVWQRRFYDFVVWSEAKRVEKLRYMHRNPVRRGFVMEPGDWAWSSFRSYAYDEPGPVFVNEPRCAELKIRRIGGGKVATQDWLIWAVATHPCKERKDGATSFLVVLREPYPNCDLS